MSHTGTVIRPNQSPGLIRVVTAGHVIRTTRTGNDEFIFCKPVSEAPTLIQAQERFVYFDTKNGKRTFPHGSPVTFDLVNFELYRKKQNRKSFDDEVKQIVNEIPGIWKKRLGDDTKFKFRYVATKIEVLPNEFILSDFYKFIRNLKKSTIEYILDGLKKIHYFDFYQSFPVIRNDHNEAIDIERVRLLDYDVFSKRFKELSTCKTWDDYKDYQIILKETERGNPHKIMTEDETPCFQR